MPKFKVEVTAYPFITEVEVDTIDAAEELAQEMWEEEPTNREVDSVHVLEIDGQPFDGFPNYTKEEPRGIIWEKYLDYLRDWAASHRGPMFYGMTPVCFTEWKKAKYLLEKEEAGGQNEKITHNKH